MAVENAAPESEQGEEVSLHDVLTQAWDEAHDEEETPPESKAEEQETPKGDPPKDDPPKGEAEHEDENQQGAEEEEEEEQEEQSLEAPEHWSDEDKKAFAELPDEAKSLYMDKVKSLEAGYTEKFQEVAEFRKEKDTLDELFRPWEQQLQQANLSRTEWIRGAVQAQQALMTNPREAIAYLAQQYGVDLNELGKKPDDKPDTPDDEYLDPKAAQRIKELEERIEKFTSQSEEKAKADQARQQQQTYRQQIEEFANAKGEDDKPLHPHFNEVREQMGRLIQAGIAPDLEQAYIQSVRLMGLNGGEQKPAPEKTQKEKEDAEKAKRAAKKPPKRKPGKAAKPEDELSLRDSLEKAWDEHVTTSD